MVVDRLNRRRFVFLGALALASCRSDGILATCRQTRPISQYGPAYRPDNEVWISGTFSGSQNGTKTNPYTARNAAEFDALMGSFASDELVVSFWPDQYYTKGEYEWGQYAGANWRMGKRWQIEGNGSTLTVQPEFVDSAPLHMICTREQLTFPETRTVTGEQVWAGLPVGQAVRNLNFDAKHSVLADRWKAADCLLKTGATILQGHNAAIEKCGAHNFGALRNSKGEYAEAFPFMICGAMGAPDRDALATLDPEKYIFDAEGTPSHIIDCTFTGYDPSSSDDQVTVFAITTSVGEPGGWNTGNWKQLFRANAYQTGNSVVASGNNLVQAHTIYEVLKGTIRGNTSVGAYVGTYGDFYSTKNLDIYENSFRQTWQGIRILLSPDGSNPQDFYHEGYNIGPNDIESSDVDVYIDTLANLRPTSATRYIRNMNVDKSLSLRAVGVEGLYRTKECA